MSPPELNLAHDGNLCHPYDISRALTPVTKGCLPAHEPILVRGQVYCGLDFPQRALAWFVCEQERMQPRKVPDPVAPGQAGKATRCRWSATPTRIQPSRAAKKRKADATTACAPKPKKLRTTRAAALQEAAEPAGYVLSPAYGDTAADAFKADLEALLENKRAALASRCYWSTLAWSPGPSQTPLRVEVPSWCPIVAEPLACTDMAYCLHAVGRAPVSTASVGTRKTPTAPEAMMTPPMTPPAAALHVHAKQFAETRHIQERTVEMAGLRFAVDVCNGLLRVWMV